MTFKILSLDGGNGDKAGVFLSTLERRADVLGFSVHKHIDLFAGTGSGAVNALLLAWHRDPVSAFEAILRFDDEARASQSPWSIPGTINGTNAAMSAKYIKSFCDSVFGEAATLADIERPVLVSTVQLDSHEGTDPRHWQPHIFTNFPGDVGRLELISTVVQRTMAMPLQYPIYRGPNQLVPAYVDGAVSNNNPAMTALTGALAHHKHLQDLCLLSIGTPRNLAGQSNHLAPQTSYGEANWGYKQWMLDPFNPLVLIDMMLQVSAESVTRQCKQLLGARFHRVDPPVFAGPSWDKPESNAALDNAIDWLKAHDWVPAAVAAENKADIVTSAAPPAGRSTTAKSRSPKTPPTA